jgi:hypothetical protein
VHLLFFLCLIGVSVCPSQTILIGAQHITVLIPGRSKER